MGLGLEGGVWGEDNLARAVGMGGDQGHLVRVRVSSRARSRGRDRGRVRARARVRVRVRVSAPWALSRGL